MTWQHLCTHGPIGNIDIHQNQKSFLSDAKMLPNARPKISLFLSSCPPSPRPPSPASSGGGAQTGNETGHRSEPTFHIHATNPLTKLLSAFCRMQSNTQIVLEKNSIGTCPFNYPTFNLRSGKIATSIHPYSF